MKNMKPDFNFFVEIDDKCLEKASKQEGEAKYDDMIIAGIASDESVDSDDEVLEPAGFQLDRFLKFGFLNYDHRSKDDSKFIIGEPIEAKVINNKFYVKAKLYKDRELARNIYDTMLMLKKAGSTRKMGFSIEGKAITRDEKNPKIVKEALITGLAATFVPKNLNSYADIVKGKYSQPIKPIEYDIEKSFTEANGGKVTYLVDITDHEKGLRYTIDTDLKLKVEKAMNSVNAKALIPESLEGGKKKALLTVVSAVNKGLFNKSILNTALNNIKNSGYKKYL